MSKRSSLKGKGTDICLASEEDPQEETLLLQGRGLRRKATIYGPSDLLNQLDDAWLDLRRIDREVMKHEEGSRRRGIAPTLRSGLSG